MDVRTIRNCRTRQRQQMTLFDTITPIYLSTEEIVYKTSYKDENLIAQLIDEINIKDNGSNDMFEAYITTLDLHRRHPGFQKLDNLLKNMFAKFFKEYFNEGKNLNALEMWGVKYRAGEYCKRHKHSKKFDVWSGVFYLTVPENSSPLLFEDFNRAYFPKVGDVLFWKGHVYHSVGPGTNTDERITAVFNYR